MNAAELIDLERYPLDRPESEAFAALLAQVRQDLDRDGCAVLKGFLRPSGIAAGVAEAERASVHAHRSFNRTNAYFTQSDPSLPPDHPVNRFYDRSNAFVPADSFAPGDALRTVFDMPGFDPFIKAAFRQDRFFRYADPLADVIVNMAVEGNGFPWHFDTNNFTVTIALQNAEGGGAFEYAPDIRRGGEDFDAVARVLDGTSDQVKILNLEPGDLQLFKGRYSLHRVAPLTGARPRYVAIFSYVEEPDMVGAPERVRQLYGKVLPIHLERAGHRADTYLD